MLVFAVVVLAVLALLTTAFLIVARHAIAASKSTVTSMQADVAALSGNGRAQAMLGQSVKNNYTNTHGGVVTNVNGDLFLINAKEQLLKGPASNSVFNLFEHDENFDIANAITTPSYAVLSSQFPDEHNGVTTTGAVNTPYFSSAPLRIDAYSLGADRAEGYYMRASMTEFYGGVNPVIRKPLTATGTVRGRNYVWVRDLDSNFLAIPALWGLNLKNVPNAPSERAIAQAILEYLRTTPNSQMSSTMSQADPAFIAGINPPQLVNSPLVAQYFAQGGAPSYTLGQMPDSIASFALLFPQYENSPNYAFWRADLDNYFTAYFDAAKNPDGSYKVDPSNAMMPVYKTGIAAININTAPEETIQALISQIPFSDSGTLATIKTPSGQYYYSEALAKRIVGKRPFLCRMDFEDFVASLLPGNPTDGTTPVGAILSALQKRVEVQRPDGTMATELRLSQFMEIAGLPEGDYPPDANGNVKLNPYKDANTKPRMITRFNYFLDDSDTTIPTRSDCVLSVKAFNNVLNSLSACPNAGLNAYNVRQVIPGGTTGLNAGDVIISSTGNLGNLHPGGDDTISGNNVVAGPNGTAETELFGFSYYSHDYAAQEYKPNRLNTAGNVTTDPSDPRVCGKFVYGDPAANYVPLKQNPNTQKPYNNYGIEDLQKWSCIGEGTLSGYYDMWFNIHDKMIMELGEDHSKDQPPATPDMPCITADDASILLTGVHGDDVQEVNMGDPVDPGSPVALPGANMVLETLPNALNSNGQPGDDKVVKAIRLSMYDSTTFDNGIDPNDTWYPFANDGYDYIIPGPSGVLMTPLQPPDPNNPDPNDIDVLVDIIIDGGNGICDTSASDDVRSADGLQIQIGANLMCNSDVWGPIRASQRPIDQPYALDNQTDLARRQVPTARITSGNMGDVAWSPPICYRSRFYGLYVLAQGLSTQPKVYGTNTGGAVAVGGSSLTFTTTDTNTDLSQVLYPGALLAVASVPSGYVTTQTNVYVVNSFAINGLSAVITISSPVVTPINPGDNAAIYSTQVTGERRIESTYDALNDEVLWTKSPLTDKRALGDP
ncbi:MAG TPA: hypothetical protein VKX17_14385 [Planctomycetota bacterium]|nr:hypothetical protein [Planctomycetota bacterium]